MKIPLLTVIGLLMILTGCAVYGGGPYYGDGPDGYLFGSDYDNGRDVQNYSHRGYESRGAAHSSGSHGAAHSGGGGGARR